MGIFFGFFEGGVGGGGVNPAVEYLPIVYGQKGRVDAWGVTQNPDQKIVGQPSRLTRTFLWTSEDAYPTIVSGDFKRLCGRAGGKLPFASTITLWGRSWLKNVHAPQVKMRIMNYYLKFILEVKGVNIFGDILKP